MRYIGIDYGAKRVGVAISDTSGTFAFPEMSLENNVQLLTSLETLMKEKNIESIVVGDTRGSSGVENPITEEAEQFAHTLTEKTLLPVHFTREIFSSIEATRYAPADSGHKDAAAAAIILQRFLDANKG